MSEFCRCASLKFNNFLNLNVNFKEKQLKILKYIIETILSVTY